MKNEKETSIRNELLEVNEAIKELSLAGTDTNQLVKGSKAHEQLEDLLEKLNAYEQQHTALCEKFGVNSIEDLYSKSVEDFAERLHHEEFDNAYGVSIVLTPLEVDDIAEQLKTEGLNHEAKVSLSKFKQEITDIVNRQLIAGNDDYREVYDSFYDIVKVVQDNY